MTIADIPEGFLPLPLDYLSDMATSPEAKLCVYLGLTYLANNYLGVSWEFGALVSVSKYSFDCFKRQQASHEAGAKSKRNARP